MSTLPCGHMLVDPSGCFCATCGRETVRKEESYDKVQEVTEERGALMKRQGFTEGLVQAANDELFSGKGRREFLCLFLDAVTALLAGAGLYTSHSIKREADTHKRSDWQAILATIESAIEGNNKDKRLSQLAGEYRTAGSNTAASLCDAARAHLCLGEPLAAHKSYKALISDFDTWNSLPPRTKRHVLIKFGKVSNNIGRHPEAAKAFQEIVDLGLDETIDERLGTIREALNSFRQMLDKASLVDQPSLGGAPVLDQIEESPQDRR
jgi:tetratricopeptide (TPR) repeat protein